MENGVIDFSNKKAVPMDSSVIYDVIIIGGGPAAMTAAVYCMRKGIKTGVITYDIGGQISWTKSVENYMGYRYIEGNELVEKFEEQVKQFEIGYSEGIKVKNILLENNKIVVLEDDSRFMAKSIIIASGKAPNRLNVKGEAEYTGRGVAYCAVCDGPLYRRKDVIVAGGGNSAIGAAIELSNIVKSVTVVQFLDRLTADKVLIDELAKRDNIKVILNHEIIECAGNEYLERVIIRDRNSSEEEILEALGMFVEIGLMPNTDFVKGVLELNEKNEIKIDASCKTNIDGIFAAGDVTEVPFKQIIIAAGEGAKAALSACDYVMFHR